MPEKNKDYRDKEVEEIIYGTEKELGRDSYANENPKEKHPEN